MSKLTVIRHRDKSRSVQYSQPVTDGLEQVHRVRALGAAAERARRRFSEEIHIKFSGCWLPGQAIL